MTSWNRSLDSAFRLLRTEGEIAVPLHAVCMVFFLSTDNKCHPESCDY